MGWLQQTTPATYHPHVWFRVDCDLAEFGADYTTRLHLPCCVRVGALHVAVSSCHFEVGMGCKARPKGPPVPVVLTPAAVQDVHVLCTHVGSKRQFDWPPGRTARLRGPGGPPASLAEPETIARQSLSCPWLQLVANQPPLAAQRDDK